MVYTKERLFLLTPEKKGKAEVKLFVSLIMMIYGYAKPIQYVFTFSGDRLCSF